MNLYTFNPNTTKFELNHLALGIPKEKLVNAIKHDWGINELSTVNDPLIYTHIDTCEHIDLMQRLNVPLLDVFNVYQMIPDYGNNDTMVMNVFEKLEKQITSVCQNRISKLEYKQAKHLLTTTILLKDIKKEIAYPNSSFKYQLTAFVYDIGQYIDNIKNRGGSIYLL